VADFLVTGTDTGVGKTVVAAALVLALRASGRRAAGFKPLETGIGGGAEDDASILARATGDPEPLTQPLLALTEALAPAVAAGRAGVAIDPADIEARVRALRDRGYDAIVVEGAGGVAVPLTWGYTALDLARHLGLSAVVVGRAGLGTLNHVWLTVEALAARDVPVAAVVLNGRSAAPDLAEQTNPDALARLLPRVRCVVVPRVDGAGTWEIAQRVAPLLSALTASAG
jgi:dethiobiotin synthetase